MATVRLGRNQCENGQLPLICMRCGAAAEDFVQQKFTWHNERLSLTMFLGIVPNNLTTSTLDCRMTVRAPVCSAHRHHWSNRKLFNYFMPIAVMASAMTLVVFRSTTLFPRELQEQVTTFTGISLRLLILIWVIVSVIWNFQMIQPEKIDDHSITLKGVAPGFVAAVQAQT
jgi:hypothetical protein